MFILLRPVSRPKNFCGKQQAGARFPWALRPLRGALANPHHSLMRQPAHAYSSLSITIHHRAGKQFAGAGKYLRRRRGAAFAVGGPARRAPDSRPAAKHPSGVKVPGSVGAPPYLTAARSACAGSFPLDRSDGAAPALAAVPLVGLPARGQLVRQMPARAVPEALRAERSASAERGGWPDHCADADRITSGPDRKSVAEGKRVDLG